MVVRTMGRLENDGPIPTAVSERDGGGQLAVLADALDSTVMRFPRSMVNRGSHDVQRTQTSCLSSLSLLCTL